MGLFGGSSSSSSAQGQSQSALNSSGWVIGKGDANGGKTDSTASLTDSQGFKWYQWLAFASIGLVLLKKIKR